MCEDEDSSRDDCIHSYNKDLMDPIDSQVRLAAKILVFAGALLDVLALRWIFLADFIIYHECLLRIILTLIVDDTMVHTDRVYEVARFAYIHAVYYCDQDFSVPIFANTLACLFQSIFALFAYNHEITLAQICKIGGLSIALFMLQCLLTMLIIYQQNLHALLSKTNKQNKLILNGMHEGILVLADSGPECAE